MLTKIALFTTLLCTSLWSYADNSLPKEHCLQLLQAMSALAHVIKKQSQEPIDQNFQDQTVITRISEFESKKIELRKLAIRYMHSGCLTAVGTKKS